MKFIVIENQRGDLDSLILVLKHAFPSAEIVTKPGEVVNLWSSAVNCVSKELESKELIVFTDIALDDNSSADAQAGLEQIRRVFAIKPDATWIAFTSFTEVVESEEAGEIFHAVLSKQKFNKPRKIHERAQYVAKIVQSGIGKSTGSSSCVFSANDSLGMRTFLAVFSRFALEEIILAECQGWTGVVVSALSAGYSGASLLALRGSLSGVMRRIVVKVAARADTIERETKILTEFFGEAQEFSRRCASAQPLKPLPRGLGYYSIQEAVAGETLFSVINDDQSVKSSAVRSILKAIVDVELVQSGAAINLLDEKEHRKRRIGLLPVDIDRIKKSCSELRGMASCLKHDGGWPSTDVDPELLFRNIEVTALNWNEALDNLPPLLWVLQHGDLNPHNVIVGELGQPTFIDLARLDRWPVGYDLCRLSMQLKLRLVDRAESSEWVRNNLGVWTRERLFQVGAEGEWKSMLCPAASFFEHAMTNWIRNEPNAESIMLGLRISALMDLLRIISYADLSPFKRLWAAIDCGFLIEELEQMQ